MADPKWPQVWYKVLSNSEILPTLIQMKKATFLYFDTNTRQKVEDVLTREEMLESPEGTPDAYIKAICKDPGEQGTTVQQKARLDYQTPC